MKNLFEQKEILEAAKNELARIKDLMSSYGFRIEEEITSFGEFIYKSIKDERKAAETLTVVTMQDSTQAVICSLDLLVKGSNELRDKIANFLSDLSDINPLDEVKVDFQLKSVTEQDIVNAVTALIDINGATTTLEVKTYLRDKGFKVDQETVHKTLNDMYESDYLSFKMKSETIPGKGTVQFRNYTEGSEYYTLEQMGFVPAEDDEDDDNANYNVKSDATDSVQQIAKDLADIANVQFTNIVERNKAIMTAKNYGHSNKAIAEAFGMSERNARKIITGK